jgi:cell division FtsZ-interacting protein ZapD
MTVLPLTGPSLRPGWILLFAAAFPFLTPSVHAQSAPSPGSPPAAQALSSNSGFVDATGMDGVRSRMLHNMARQRDDLRQKAIVDDTSQLLALAEQLKAAVDKSDKNRVSLDAIHAVAQIEKLAKTVEKKMRDAD